MLKNRLDTALNKPEQTKLVF